MPISFLAVCWKWVTDHQRLLLTIAGLVALLLFIAFAVSKCETYNAERYKSKKMSNINAGLQEISNIQSQIQTGKGNIQELQGRKEEIKQQIVTDTQDLANVETVRQDQRIQTNQALANFNTAIHTNSNVNATAEDLDRIARQLQENP